MRNRQVLVVVVKPCQPSHAPAPCSYCVVGVVKRQSRYGFVQVLICMRSCAIATPSVDLHCAAAGLKGVWQKQTKTQAVFVKSSMVANGVVEVYVILKQCFSMSLHAHCPASVG